MFRVKLRFKVLSLHYLERKSFSCPLSFKLEKPRRLTIVVQELSMCNFSPKNTEWHLLLQVWYTKEKRVQYWHVKKHCSISPASFNFSLFPNTIIKSRARGGGIENFRACWWWSGTQIRVIKLKFTAFASISSKMIYCRSSEQSEAAAANVITESKLNIAIQPDLRNEIIKPSQTATPSA